MRKYSCDSVRDDAPQRPSDERTALRQVRRHEASPALEIPCALRPRRVSMAGQIEHMDAVVNF